MAQGLHTIITTYRTNEAFKMDLKQLPEGVGATLDMIMRQKTTESIEMATLYMMNRYSFDFDHLRRVIECTYPAARDSAC